MTRYESLTLLLRCAGDLALAVRAYERLYGAPDSALASLDAADSGEAG